MSHVLTFHDGQAYVEAKADNPYPVHVVGDVQSLNTITGYTGQVSVATSATQIVPENPNRRSIKITQITGSQPVYLGFSAALTSSNGDYFSATTGSSLTIYAKGAIFGVAVTTAQTVSYMEEEYEAS